MTTLSLPAMAPARIATRQWQALLLVTLAMGASWPTMKVALATLPPLTFRALSMLLAVPCIALTLRLQNVPFSVPRHEWRNVGQLTLTNMVAWHMLLILSLPALTSGRAAILGYTMPVFATLWGWGWFGESLNARKCLGMIGTAAAVGLLLWHEVSQLSGVPSAALTVILGAAIWAFGTQLLNRTRGPIHTLTLTFWMTLLTGVVIGIAAILLERDKWQPPSNASLLALLYNALFVLGVCQAASFYLIRTLPAVAASTSMMLIPIIGIGCGALWLGEPLHWQDGAAVALVAMAIGVVLLDRPKAA